MKSKYDIIATRLREDIEKGVYTDKLPSERHLAEIFKTTTVTIRRAQDILIEAGLLRKIQPLGTFVVPRHRPKIKISLLNPMFFPEAVKEINKSFIKAFPEVDVDLQQVVFDPAKLDEFDLVRVAGVSPLPYPDFAMPFPENLIEKFRNGQYFQQAFDVHRVGDCNYGIPLLVSPVLMAINLDYVKTRKVLLNPYAIDIELLLELAATAKRKKVFLWDITTVHYLLRSLVFSSGDKSNLLCNVKPGRLRSLMKKFWPLLSTDLVSSDRESFKNGQAIMSFTCRQGMYEYDLAKTALLAWPVELSDKINLAGEFLFLNNRCPVPDTAMKVAVHFISSEIQNIIGKYHLGLPVLKSAAVDSIDSHLYRDDLFFNEIKNVYINDTSAYDFNHRLRYFAGDIVNGSLKLDAFMKHLEYEIGMIKKREQTKQHFMLDGLSQAV